MTQLKSIGEFISAGTDFGKLTKIVKNIDDVSKAADILKKINILDDIKVGVLAPFAGNANKAKELLGIADDMADIGDAANDTVPAITKLGSAFKGLKSSGIDKLKGMR